MIYTLLGIVKNFKNNKNKQTSYIVRSDICWFFYFLSYVCEEMSYKWPNFIDMKEINSDNRWPRHTQQKPVTPLVYKTIKTQCDYDKTWRKYMLSLETGTTRCQRRVWRYQRGNQNPYIEEGQRAQWSKEKWQKDKQRSSKHYT